ncbi:MAG: Rrf2 family transcriptional regulator [Pseudomonadota bacterium]
MRLSTKTRYGLRAMVDLATHDGQGPILIESIARRQEVSRKYLDAIFGRLREAGLLRSQRGAKGGVMLGRKADLITVADVVRALEGPIRLVDCETGGKPCRRKEICVTHDLWIDIAELMEKKMEGVTVGELSTQMLLKEAAGSSMYHI